MNRESLMLLSVALAAFLIFVGMLWSQRRYEAKYLKGWPESRSLWAWIRSLWSPGSWRGG